MPRVFIVSGTSAAVPADCEIADAETIGGGGGGAGNDSPVRAGCVGGGGGGYSKTLNIPLTPSASISLQVGSGGSGGATTSAGVTGTDTWYNGASLAASSVGAKGGVGGTLYSVSTNAALGGAASSGVGTTKFSGGNSGNNTASGGFSGTGGGGAAGPNGAGANGGSTSDYGGSGGGGNGGGGNGVNATSGAGDASNGGTAVDTTAGGIGGTHASPGNPGTAGSHGSGGGGGGKGDNATNGGVGGVGGNGLEWDAIYGSGGGGGGGGTRQTSPADAGAGGNGGLYGGGGGGGGGGNLGGAGGNGAQGLIVLTYVSNKELNAGPRRKPTGVPAIDWRHPLARGLMFYGFDPGYGEIINLVAGHPVRHNVSKPPIGTSKYGAGFVHVGAAGDNTTGFGINIDIDANRDIVNASDLKNLGTNLAFSYACGFVQTADSNGLIFGRVSSAMESSPFINWVIQAGSGLVVNVGLNNNGTSQYLTSYPISLNWYTTAVVSVLNTSSGAGTASFYVNGAAADSASTSLTATNPSTDAESQIMFGACWHTDTGKSFNGWSGFVFYGAVWNRTLSQDEAAWLHRDPYAFLIFPQRVKTLAPLFVPPAANIVSKKQIVSKVAVNRASYW